MSSSTTGDREYEAEVRVTTHGVAHVRAGDWGGIGFGQGWACARDNLPTLADQFAKVRSERALAHGPGPQDANLASDFGYLALGVAEKAATLRDAQPDDIRELVAGYAAGYNRALLERRADGSLPDWCAGEWVRPVSELEYYAHLVDLALMGSGRNLAQLAGRAEAPGPDGPAPPSPMEALVSPTGASNGWALGGDVTASGHGMVLANPHFPWWGEARFWECHLTLPGELDAYGVSLIGVPGVSMGCNAGVAWALTFSIGNRFTFYKLDLVPDAPTRYRYGDDERAMTPATHVVSCRDGDGEVRPVERVLWSSHYGPMLNPPLIGWGTDTGFTYRDANADNVSVIRQFLGMCRATDLDAFKQVYAEVQGIPWVNTMAADRSGRAWYTDASATPRLGAAAQERFRARLETDFLAQLLYENRAALLDGSDPDDEWQDAPGARSPGLEPFAHLPQLERRDYVVNSNDPYWLVNLDEPLPRHNVLCGRYRAPLSLRTRQNLRLAGALAERGAVTRDDLLAALLDNASLSASLLRHQVAARCRAAGAITVEGHHADLARVADVLEAWDGRVGLDARGAVLWREILAWFDPDALRDAGPLFADAFDPDDPIARPSLLAPPPTDGDPSADQVLHAAGHAVRVLEQAGFAIDVRLGDVQYAIRGDERVPVPGGGELEGMVNVLSPVGLLPMMSLEPTPPKPVVLPGRERSGLSAEGYPCDYGASFVMVVELTDDGPVGSVLTVYGQTADPASPDHAAQVRAFAAGELRPIRFHDADVEADVRERVTLRS